ncbi:RNA polymerase sigma factor [uncultured Friedmanniella sp.]|uniref:RNA polymerase sigma factor n=1 Tax=uncultured Friedmanniella sp. TaxID=335381 RepID=UPI0035CB4944
MDDDDVTVSSLVRAAAAGDRTAWDDLVRRFMPLVLSVASRYRLGSADVADVTQTVWLRLLQHLDRLREPAALPGWLVTTTRHECLRLLASSKRVTSLEPILDRGVSSGPTWQPWSDDFTDGLVQTERHEALLTAFAGLSERDRQLLSLLIEDPPPSYAEISDRLQIPIGSIGPTRARALDRLRRSPAIAALRTTDDT